MKHFRDTPLYYAPTARASYAWHMRSAKIHRYTAKRLGAKAACYPFEIQDAYWHLNQARLIRQATILDAWERLP